MGLVGETNTQEKRQAQRQKQAGITHPGVTMSRGTDRRQPKTETDPHREGPPALGFLDSIEVLSWLCVLKLQSEKAAQRRHGHQGARGPGISGCWAAGAKGAAPLGGGVGGWVPAGRA